MGARSKRWYVAAWIFTLVNLGGAVFAAAGGEMIHAAIHVALLVPGVFWILRLSRPADRQQVAAQHSNAPHVDAQLDHLQQSLDAIALGVERIGEAQRFNVKLAAAQAEKAPVEPRQQPSRPERNET